MAGRTWYLVQRVGWDDAWVGTPLANEPRLRTSIAWQGVTFARTGEFVSDEMWARTVPQTLFPNRAAADVEAELLEAAARAEVGDLLDERPIYEVVDIELED